MTDLVEFFSACFALVNLPFTLLLAVMLLYWVTVILGALDLDSIEIDLDADLEGAPELDGEVDGGADGATSDGAFITLLKFFNVGEVPLMILLSFFFLSLWMISMASNHLLGNRSVIFALILLVPNGFISLMVTKMISTPIKALFRGLNKQGEEHERLIGKTCVVTSRQVDADFGTAEIRRNGPPVTLNVRAQDDAVIPKGAEAAIIEEEKEQGFYWVKVLDL